MSKMGRPRKEIDFSAFEALCKIQCTKEEVAAYFDIDDETLDARLIEQYGGTFSKVYAQKRGLGHISIRRKQFELALAGNATMLIWYGKNYLGQSDKIEQRTDIALTPPTEIEVKFKIIGDESALASQYDP